MLNICVKIADEMLHVTTPFPHVGFNRDAKDAQGLWVPQKAVWTFDVRNEEFVRKALVKHYGGDGTMPADVVSIILEVEKRTACQGPVVIIGRVIARAFGRDTGSKLGPGVVFISGTHTSGGSRIYWQTVVEGEFLLHDVPRAIATRLIEGKSRVEGVTARIYDAPTKILENGGLMSISGEISAQNKKIYLSSRKLKRARSLAKIAQMPTAFDAALETIGYDIAKKLNGDQIAVLADRICTSWSMIRNMALAEESA